MNQEQCESLAEKLLEETLENIRRLGFVVMIKEGECPVQVSPKAVFVISQERYQRGDYW